MELVDLAAYGADVEDGLARCMGNAELYLRLVEKLREETSLEELRGAIAAEDLEGAFRVAHTLKGVFGNLSLTPLYEPTCEMTELLRAGTRMDYTGYLTKLEEAWEAFAAL